MASCKDCVHADMCRFYTEELAKAKGITLGKDIFEYFSSGDVCDHFKDRSRFVELPCKLGDTVYYFNSAGEIYSQKVSGFIVNFVGILVDSDVMFDSHLMGDRFFSTRKEAEQALKLKERENDAE